jgi:hypothetical protein
MGMAQVYELMNFERWGVRIQGFRVRVRVVSKVARQVRWSVVGEVHGTKVGRGWQIVESGRKRENICLRLHGYVWWWNGAVVNMWYLWRVCGTVPIDDEVREPRR